MKKEGNTAMKETDMHQRLRDFAAQVAPLMRGVFRRGELKDNNQTRLDDVVRLCLAHGILMEPKPGESDADYAERQVQALIDNDHPGSTRPIPHRLRRVQEVTRKPAAGASG